MNSTNHTVNNQRLNQFVARLFQHAATPSNKPQPSPEAVARAFADAFARR